MDRHYLLPLALVAGKSGAFSKVPGGLKVKGRSRG